jgi:hypothetical protein
VSDRITTLPPLDIQDLTNQSFGRLVVLGFAGRVGGHPMWLCRCRCGTDKTIRHSHLTRQGVESCGCRKRDHAATHGRSGSKLYAVWRSMIQRCENPRDRAYRNYGGRGIGVCDKWRVSFEAFVADVGECPGPGYSLDRRENDGHYEPGNVRWVTRVTQQRNRRSNRLITCHGRTQLLTDWVKESSIHQSTIIQRLARGWTPEQALELPPGTRVMGKRT